MNAGLMNTVSSDGLPLGAEWRQHTVDVQRRPSLLSPFFSPCFPGPTVGDPHGGVPAVYPEYFRGDPLPADDLDGGDRRSLRLLRHRLHVLLHGESNSRRQTTPSRTFGPDAHV